jgi:hypothetical protein
LVEFIFESRYFSIMRRPILIFALCLVACAAVSAETGRVIKVLPQLLDLKGRHAVSPSLYDRDAYQAYLRIHTNEISGMRFAVQWKASKTSGTNLTMRVEIRGTAHGDLPPTITLQEPVKRSGWFEHWAYLKLDGDQFRRIGEVTCWRATLWDGDQLLGEQKSFLW